MRRLLLCGILLAASGLAPTLASAQDDDCFPSTDSHEAKVFALLSVPLAFSAAQAPESAPPGRLRLAVEGSLIPQVDATTRTPTVCRPGKGPENVNFLSAVPRPRASLALPAGLVLEASWIPPIRLSGVKANLFSFAIGRAFPLAAGGAVLAVRGHATVGVIHAPIVCDTDDLDDATSECFNGTRSDDAFHPNIFGVDAAVGFGGGPLRPYVGVGYNRLQPRFRVNFTNSVGDVDRRRVEVDMNRAAVFGGASWAASRMVGVTAEVYSTPTDAVTGRLVIRAALGS